MKDSGNRDPSLTSDDDLLSVLMFRSRSLASHFIGTVPAPLEVLIPLSGGVLIPPLTDRTPCDEQGDTP